jgi:homoserine dehydrogenase
MKKLIEAGVAILGYGVVGKGVANAIRNNSEQIEKRTGIKLRLIHILDLLDFPDSPDAAIITHDPQVIANDDRVDIVVETMGGLRAAYEFTKNALSQKGMS